MIKYLTENIKKRSYAAAGWIKKKYSFSLKDDYIIQKKELPVLMVNQANEFIDEMLLRQTPKAENSADLLRLVAMFAETYCSQLTLNSLLFLRGNKILAKNGRENINGFINETTDKMSRCGLLDIYEYAEDDVKTNGTGKFYAITKKGVDLVRQMGTEVEFESEKSPQSVADALESLQTGYLLTQMIKFTPCDDYSPCIDVGSPFVRLGIYGEDVYLTSLRNVDGWQARAKLELDALSSEAADSTLTAIFCLENERQARQMNEIYMRGGESYKNLEIFFTTDDAVTDVQKNIYIFRYDGDTCAEYTFKQ